MREGYRKADGPSYLFVGDVCVSRDDVVVMSVLREGRAKDCLFLGTGVDASFSRAN